MEANPATRQRVRTATTDSLLCQPCCGSCRGSQIPALTCLWPPAAELDGQLSTPQASWTSPFAAVAHTPRKSLDMAWSRLGNEGPRREQECATARRMASPNRWCLIHMSGSVSSMRHRPAKRQGLHRGPPAARQPLSQSAEAATSSAHQHSTCPVQLPAAPAP